MQDKANKLAYNIETINKWVQSKEKEVNNQTIFSNLGNYFSSSAKYVKSVVTRDGKAQEHKDNAKQYRHFLSSGKTKTKGEFDKLKTEAGLWVAKIETKKNELGLGNARSN